jgi:hypothetical protein
MCCEECINSDYIEFGLWCYARNSIILQDQSDNCKRHDKEVEEDEES